MKNKIIAMAFLMLVSFQCFASPIVSLATLGTDKNQYDYSELAKDTKVTVFDVNGEVIGTSIKEYLDEDPTWIWVAIGIGFYQSSKSIEFDKGCKKIRL